MNIESLPFIVPPLPVARVLRTALGWLVLGGAFCSGLATSVNAQVSDPFNQALVSSAPEALARFGTSVAVTGPTAVVGAPGDAAVGPDGGAVHVFLRDAASGAYELDQVIRPPGLTPFDRFGGALAIGGNLLVVGAKGDDEAAPNAGAAYVYRRFGVGNPFQLVSKLLPTAAGASDCFGVSVAVLGNKLAVGAPRTDSVALDAGTLYTYSFDFAANQIYPDVALVDPDGVAGDGFGTSVAIAPGILCVGAARLDASTGLQNTGGVIVYEDQGTNGQTFWTKVQTLQPAGLSAYAEFGAALAMEPPRPGSSGTLVVGAPENENPVTTASKGSVFIFESALPVAWVESFGYGVHEPGANSRLGTAVAIEGDLVLVGAPGSVPIDSMDSNVGHVDVLRRGASGAWTKEAQVRLPGSENNWNVGAAVAVRSGFPLVGAPGAELSGGLDREGTAWSICHSWAPLGELLCAPGVANSTGHAASLVARGSAVANDRSLTLEAAFLPRFSFAYALASQTSGFLANPGGSQGNICLSGAVGRLVNNFQQAGTDGRITIAVDTATLPDPQLGPVSVAAGETWWFQVWYRDANPGVTSNFTDAVGITFQ